MDSLGDYDKQLVYTKRAKRVWDACKIQLGVDAPVFKWFHLRPSGSGVKIITTHRSCPMRGTQKYSQGEEGLSQRVRDINAAISDVNAADDDAFYDAIKGYGYKKGFQNKEFPHQALMINGMSGNNALKKLLKTDALHFVASEIIFCRSGDENPREKIDIVVHNGKGRIFFFEIKAPDNKKDDPIAQVNRYISTYGIADGIRGKKNEIFETILCEYPTTCPIERFDHYEGYGVVGYGEGRVKNSDGRTFTLY